MNMVFLVGRLTKDPEISEVDGKKYTHITIATNRTYKSTDGTYEVDYITCSVWNAIAERVCKYCHKGDMVSVKGRVQNNNYTDKDDKKVYTYDFVCEQVSFMQKLKGHEELTTCES